VKIIENRLGKAFAKVQAVNRDGASTCISAAASIAALEAAKSICFRNANLPNFGCVVSIT